MRFGKGLGALLAAAALLVCGAAYAQSDTWKDRRSISPPSSSTHSFVVVCAP